MTDDGINRLALRKLRGLYAYDIAQARQTGEDAPASDKEEVEVLALHHLSTRVVEEIQAFVTAASDNPEMVAAAMAALMSHAGGLAGVLDRCVDAPYVEHAIGIAKDRFDRHRLKLEENKDD